MRAREFINEATTGELDGVTMIYDINTRINQLSLRAYNEDGEELGHVLFQIWEDKKLSPLELEVHAKYRGKNVAKTMYDFLKGQGYTVRRGSHQTDDGADFWNKHRGNNRVWEESTELTELFDPKTSFPLEWDEQFGWNGEVHAEAHDADGRVIHISFVPTELRLTPDSKDATEVAFSRGGNYSVTGKGDAGKVLATVVNAIEIFLQKYRPDCVVFSAKEGSRASLYASMIKRIARGYKLLTPAEYPEDVHTYLHSIGSDAPFILARV